MGGGSELSTLKQRYFHFEKVSVRIGAIKRNTHKNIIYLIFFQNAYFGCSASIVSKEEQQNRFTTDLNIPINIGAEFNDVQQ